MQVFSCLQVSREWAHLGAHWEEECTRVNFCDPLEYWAGDNWYEYAEWWVRGDNDNHSVEPRQWAVRPGQPGGRLQRPGGERRAVRRQSRGGSGEEGTCDTCDMWWPGMRTRRSGDHPIIIKWREMKREPGSSYKNSRRPTSVDNRPGPGGGKSLE